MSRQLSNYVVFDSHIRKNQKKEAKQAYGGFSVILRGFKYFLGKIVIQVLDFLVGYFLGSEHNGIKKSNY